MTFGEKGTSVILIPRRTLALSVLEAINIWSKERHNSKEGNMKRWTRTMIATIMIAVIICTLFAVFQGKALSYEGTVVVVAISAGFVIAARKLSNVFQKHRGDNENHG